MPNRLRILSTLVMVLTIAFANVGLGQARAMAPAEDFRILCARNGPVTIYVDASGRPTSPPQVCADCALVLSAMMPDLMPQLNSQRQVSSLVDLDGGRLHTGRAVVSRLARGPPPV